jgi:hypothetical protein
VPEGHDGLARLARRQNDRRKRLSHDLINGCCLGRACI